MRKCLYGTLVSTFTIGLVLFCLTRPAAAAPITFEHFCVSLAACDKDTDFRFTITLDDSVVSAKGTYDTRDDSGTAFLG
ncbi:MAG: hypothetical protein AAGI88_03340 [Pseudomonadota bacterium]